MRRKPLLTTLTTRRIVPLFSYCFQSQHLLSILRPSILFRRRGIQACSPHIAQFVWSLEIEVDGEPRTARKLARLLEKISIILPMLLGLREISLYFTQECGWLALPTSFRVAFLECLRLPLVQDISITNLTGFPKESSPTITCNGRIQKR